MINFKPILALLVAIVVVVVIIIAPLNISTENKNQVSVSETDVNPINWPWSTGDRQDPTAWRYKYIEEYGASKLLVIEESIDQRLANIIYTSTTTNWIDNDHCKFNSGNSSQDKANMALVAGPQVYNDECHYHLEQMVNLIKDIESLTEINKQSVHSNSNFNESHFQLMVVLNSFGRYESGQLNSGKIKSVGSYDICERSKLIFKPKDHAYETIKTRFCWARLKADQHLDKSLKSRRKSTFAIQSNSILAGICIPETCHSITFNNKNKRLLQTIVDSQFRLPKLMFINQTLELESIYCLPDNRGKFSMPLQGEIFILALVAWLILAVYVTTRRFMGARKSWIARMPMENLDLIQSASEFAELNHGDITMRQQRQVSLDALNVVKVLCCQFVVVVHAFIVSLQYSQDTIRLNYIVDSGDLYAAAMFPAICLMDTYFLLTGLILSYGLFKQLAREREQIASVNWISKARYFMSFCCSFAFNRYLRLVPMFVMFHWFKKYVFIYLGSGPLWDHGFNKDTPNGMCRQVESWLIPFTFWSTFLPLNKQCLLQSWSISSDILFSLLLAPLVVIMYHSKLKTALWTTLSISLLSLVIYNWELAFNTAPDLYHELQDVGKLVDLKMITTASYLYTSPWFRLSGFSTGALGGYYLFRLGTKDNQWAEKLLASPVVPVVHTMNFLALGMKIWMPTLRPLIFPYNNLILFLWPLLRLVWNLGNMIIFVKMVTTWQNPIIDRFVSAKEWKVLSKLNYLILLAHYDLLMVSYYFSAIKTTDHSSVEVFMTGCAVYVVSLGLSAILYIIFENPISKLTRGSRKWK